jgi:septal ring factor EnvC (AmiA/AmiB activator)
MGVVGLSPHVLAAKAKPQEELLELRGRIENLQKQLSEKEESRAEAADALKESEKAISEVNRRLHELSTGQEIAQFEVHIMEGQIRVLEKRVASEKLRIEKILQNRYMEGGQDALKLILNGQDPAEVARQLHYYSYISRAQAELVQRVKVDLAGLGELMQASEKKAGEIGRLKNQEMQGKNQLETERAKRKQVLAQLSNQIAGQRKEIDRLKRNEQRLTQLVEEINRMLSKRRTEAEAKTNKKSSRKPARDDETNEVPDDSFAGKAFASLKGKLKLPVRGELTNRFGSPREAGGLSWKGLFIRAESGQMVRAIADGHVVFADWLRGFGNLLIVDHGGGYMSLYGSNETLLKEVGDSIRSGDTIAMVGNTGGNLNSGLYFELRYQSKPLDPMSWVAK